MLHVTRKNAGFSLIEILVSIGVFSAIVFAAVGIFIVSQESVQIGRTKTKGVYHLKDYIEKVKNIKRADWTDLVNGRYIFIDNAGNWELQTTTTGEVLGAFTRFVDIADARRDTSGTLVTTGGTVDPSTKFITVTVSWTGIKAGTVSESTYVTRYLDNLAWIRTTKADFDAGTKTGVNSQLTGSSLTDGEVVLGAGGGGDWCTPQPIVGTVNLDKNGVANAITAIEGRVFAGTGDNSSGPSFDNVTISNANPPIGAVAGSFDGYKTNGVFGETNYAYLATDSNSKEVVMINLTSLTNGKYSEAGAFNAPGNGNANSVYVSGNTGYMTGGTKLYNFSLNANRSTATILDTDGVTLAGTGNKVVVNGSYAYVVTSSTSNQLQIIDLTTPTNLTVKSSLAINDKGATDIFINSSATRAYIVTSNSALNPEFYIVDITNKSSPAKIAGGTFDTGSMSPKGVAVVPGGRAIIVGTGGQEYQVVRISTETSPVQCPSPGGMDVDTGINGIAAVVEADGDAYSYIITGDSSSELKIILGGPGGQFATSGRWESATFDADHSSAFNRFDVTFDKPIQTNIRFQVAVVDPGVSGTCTDAVFSDFSFAGPDGTAATFYTDDGAVPIDDTGANYENPGRCARTRAYLETSDYSQSPTLYDVTVNYSP